VTDDDKLLDETFDEPPQEESRTVTDGPTSEWSQLELFTALLRAGLSPREAADIARTKVDA
jgi:hypothetical protein